jgi:hypothetical protein
MPVIPAFKRLRQEDHEFKGILGYIVRSCVQKKTKQKEKKIILKMEFISHCTDYSGVLNSLPSKYLRTWQRIFSLKSMGGTLRKSDGLESRHSLKSSSCVLSPDFTHYSSPKR